MGRARQASSFSTGCANLGSAPRPGLRGGGVPNPDRARSLAPRCQLGMGGPLWPGCGALDPLVMEMRNSFSSVPTPAQFANPRKRGEPLGKRNLKTHRSQLARCEAHFTTGNASPPPPPRREAPC